MDNHLQIKLGFIVLGFMDNHLRIKLGFYSAGFLVPIEGIRSLMPYFSHRFNHIPAIQLLGDPEIYWQFQHYHREGGLWNCIQSSLCRWPGCSCEENVQGFEAKREGVLQRDGVSRSPPSPASRNVARILHHQDWEVLRRKPFLMVQDERFRVEESLFLWFRMNGLGFRGEGWRD